MFFNESPRDSVRFQYLIEGRAVAAKCFCMFVAIARPIEPRPIQPKRGDSDVDIGRSRRSSMMCRFQPPFKS
jgi:hypothetical protein